ESGWQAADGLDWIGFDLLLPLLQRYNETSLMHLNKLDYRTNLRVQP
ncbi:hypothetical protein M5D96_013335, partial [Drosophila gunungcola]